MTKEDLKNESKSAYSACLYLKAFQILWEIGDIEEFINYAQKETKNSKSNWFLNEAAATVFWNEFIIHEDIFYQLINSTYIQTLLHYYFQKNIIAPDFDKKIAKEYPSILIEAIRVNQVFLNETRINAIINLEIDKSYLVHQKLWKYIIEKDKILWKQINDKAKIICKYNTLDILFYCIHWIESERFKNDSSIDTNLLADTYNFYMELIFKEYDASIELNTEDLNMYFVNQLNSFNSIEIKFIFDILYDIADFIKFKQQIVEIYSYDLNTNPVQIGNEIYLSSSALDYYKWKSGAIRYELNSNFNLYYGMDITDYQIESGNLKIKAKYKEDKEANTIACDKLTATNILLTDLGIQSFKIGKNEISINDILCPLLTFSTNKLHRYEKTYYELKENSKNWYELFFKLTVKSVKTDRSFMPFILITKKEYFDKNEYALKNITINTTAQILELFAYNPNKDEVFNRYKNKFDVYDTPFFIINQHIFCPTTFFASNLWYFSFAQKALTYRDIADRKETEKTEDALENAFKDKGWQTKTLTIDETNSIEGDVDLFVFNETITLLIQVKRTKFRFNIEEAYYEKVNSDTKAASQLNKAEKYLRNSNEIFQLNNNAKKWIVSTSFENIGDEINSCKKVNYLELLNQLRTSNQSNLSEFIEYIEKDKHIIEIVERIKEINRVEGSELTYLNELLAPYKSKNYNIFVQSENPANFNEIRTIFHEALKLNLLNRKHEAIQVLFQYIQVCPYDGNGHSTIARIFTDLNILDKAIYHYKFALNLFPLDPNIARNYALALYENTSYYESLKQLLVLAQTYPLYGDFISLLKDTLLIVKEDGLIPEDKISEIELGLIELMT